MPSVGESVASAREARESMIRLTQSICTAVRGDSWTVRAPTQAVATATMLTVSCRQKQKGRVRCCLKEDQSEQTPADSSHCSVQ